MKPPPMGTHCSAPAGWWDRGTTAQLVPRQTKQAAAGDRVPVILARSSRCISPHAASMPDHLRPWRGACSSAAAAPASRAPQAPCPHGCSPGTPCSAATGGREAGSLFCRGTSSQQHLLSTPANSAAVTTQRRVAPAPTWPCLGDAAHAAAGQRHSLHSRAADGNDKRAVHSIGMQRLAGGAARQAH